MKFSVTWLWIMSAFFMAFGFGFIIFPTELADLTTGSALAGPSAIIDMRAAHGGAPLGVGVFMGICARRRGWLRPGLVVALLMSAALGASRLVGIAIDGLPSAPMVASLVTEVTFAVLSAIGLQQLSRTSQHAG